MTSELVIQECSRGDAGAAAQRLTVLANIAVLGQSEKAGELARALIAEVPIPVKAVSDAIHIAIAATNGVQFLLSWNCRHLVNAVLLRKIEATCRRAGFEPPVIATPTHFGFSAGDDDES